MGSRASQETLDRYADLRPRNGLVLVKKHKLKSESDAGVIINIYGDDEPNYGDVLAVGPDVKDLKPGDIVVFNHYTGNRIDYRGESLFMMPEAEVLMTVDEEDF